MQPCALSGLVVRDVSGKPAIGARRLLLRGTVNRLRSTRRRMTHGRPRTDDHVGRFGEITSVPIVHKLGPQAVRDVSDRISWRLQC